MEAEKYVQKLTRTSSKRFTPQDLKILQFLL